VTDFDVVSDISILTATVSAKKYNYFLFPFSSEFLGHLWKRMKICRGGFPKRSVKNYLVARVSGKT